MADATNVGTIQYPPGEAPWSEWRTPPETDVVIKADSADDEAHACFLWLRQFIERAYPPKHRMRSLFDFVSSQAGESGIPPAPLARQVMDLFWRLPEAEQRRVFNGWTPDRGRPSIAQLAAELQEEPQRFLKIEADGHNAEKLDASLEWIGDGSTVPVKLLIAEGTSRETALAALETLQAFVTLHFERAIVDPQKSRAAHIDQFRRHKHANKNLSEIDVQSLVA